MSKRPNQSPAHSRRRAAGFSLMELLVVMAIIILFIALAIPAINAITGTRSIANAENNLSALMARAREEAVGVQEIRGVLFYLDPATDGVAGAIVRDTGTGAATGIVMLDTVPSHDYLALPKGIRLQTIFDGNLMDPSNPNPNHYLGFNSAGLNAQTPGFAVKYGGVVLFDSDGRVTVRRYGFQLSQPNNAANPSGLGDLFHLIAGQTQAVPRMSNLSPLSQAGFMLFDKKTFLSTKEGNGTNYSDGDATLDRAGASDSEEEGWIDQNGTPILVNRYTGTLIRGE